MTAVLQELLGDQVSPRDFCDRYWGRESLVVRGDAERLERTLGFRFDRGGFDYLSAALTAQEQRITHANAARGLDIGAPWRATFDQKRFISRRGPNTFLQVRPEQVPTLLDAGASVQLASIDALEGERAGAIARTCERLRSDLQFPGDVLVGATRSPAGSGFESHFDPTGAFIVQTAGRKRYWFQRAPTLVYPRSKAYLFDDGTVGYRPDYQVALSPWETLEQLPEPLFDEQVELGPGDWLYIPPGIAHRTEALTESFALLVIFSQRNPVHHVHGLLQRAFLPDPRWREQPTFLASDAAPGRLPEGVVATFAARLAELRRYLDALDPAGYELAYIHRQAVARVETWPAVRADAVAIGPETRLRATRDGVLQIARGVDVDGVERAAVFRGQTEVEVEGAWCELLVRAASTGAFAALEACGWHDGGERLDWDDVRDVLEALVEQGVVEPIA